MINYHDLRGNTENLLQILEKGKNQFELTKSTGIEVDFFTEVKPFADQVKFSLDQWIKLATNFLQANKPPLLNEKQLQSTYDHIEKISIQSFFPKTSRKHYLNSYRSAQFILESLLKHINNIEQKKD